MAAMWSQQWLLTQLPSRRVDIVVCSPTNLLSGVSFTSSEEKPEDINWKVLEAMKLHALSGNIRVYLNWSILLLVTVTSSQTELQYRCVCSKE